MTKKQPNSDKVVPIGTKKGSKADDKAENPKAVAGDNQLSEDQKAALFHNHLRHIEPLIAAKDKAVADLRNAYKMAKAEGTTKADIDTALRLKGEKGEAAVRADIEDKIRVARWLGASVGYQIELFPDRRPSEERAKDDGKVCGLAGLPMKPPFDPGKLYDAFVAGWNDGQAALTMKLAPKPPQQTPEPPTATPEPKAPTPPKPSMAGGLEDQPQNQQK